MDNFTKEKFDHTSLKPTREDWEKYQKILSILGVNAKSKLKSGDHTPLLLSRCATEILESTFSESIINVKVSEGTQTTDMETVLNRAVLKANNEAETRKLFGKSDQQLQKRAEVFETAAIQLTLIKDRLIQLMQDDVTKSEDIVLGKD